MLIIATNCKQLKWTTDEVMDKSLAKPEGEYSYPNNGTNGLRGSAMTVARGPSSGWAPYRDLRPSGTTVFWVKSGKEARGVSTSRGRHALNPYLDTASIYNIYILAINPCCILLKRIRLMFTATLYYSVLSKYLGTALYGKIFKQTTVP